MSGFIAIEEFFFYFIFIFIFLAECVLLAGGGGLIKEDFAY